MGEKLRSPDKTAISVSLPKDFAEQITKRAKTLGLNRSQYLLALAKKDLSAEGSLVLIPQGTSGHEHGKHKERT